MAEPMRYAIDLARDDAGWWVAVARDVSGCHTQGRSIRQSLSRVREALSASIGEDVAPQRLEPYVHLPAETRRAVAKYQSAYVRLERDREAARKATAQAVGALVDELSLSVRDAADVLGLSHQRVSQLANQRPR